MILLGCLQVNAIFNARGVVDQEGYIFSPSRLVMVNTYEDDGSICLAGALGLIGPEEKFSHYFNIGGPFIHIGRAALLLGQSLGLVRLHDDPTAYLAHPEDFRGVWRFFGLYKLIGFVLWLPPLAFWVCAKISSRRAGIIAAWLVAVCPFLSAFEPRLKVDSAALSVGLASLLFQLEYAQTGRRGFVYISALLLGFGLAMKFTILPMAATLVLSLFFAPEPPGGFKQRLKLGLQVGILACISFIASNPFVIKSLAPLAMGYLNYVAAPPQAPVQQSILSALVYRLLNFDPIVGWPLNILVLPATTFLLWTCIRKGVKENAFIAFILTAFVFDILYLMLFVRSGIATLTYYFLTPGILVILIISIAAGMAIDKLNNLRWPALATVAIVVLLTFKENVSVLNYIGDKSNRQKAHEWIESTIEEDSRVGVPFLSGEQMLNSIIRLDPFRYDLAPVGPDAALTRSYSPAAVLLSTSALVMPNHAPSGMSMAALFDSGQELPRDFSRDLYQDELYVVYAPENIPPRNRPPLTPENFLGRAMRQDTEQSYGILQFQALGLRPQSLTMLRKQDGTLLPVSWAPWQRLIRGINTLSYVHQIPPIVMKLWGIKYILARTGEDSPFVTQTTAHERHALSSVLQGRFMINSSDRDITLYRCGTYSGQAFFMPEAQALFSLKPGRGRYLPREVPVPLHGRLLNTKGHDSVEIVLSLETQGEVDLILGMEGNRASYLFSSGYASVSIPFEPRGVDIPYEINPASPGARTNILSLTVKPMSLMQENALRMHSISATESFVTATVDTAGSVVFSIPYDKRTKATINGVLVPCLPGPAETTAVPVQPGSSFIHLRTTG